LLPFLLSRARDFFFLLKGERKIDRPVMVIGIFLVMLLDYMLVADCETTAYGGHSLALRSRRGCLISVLIDFYQFGPNRDQMGSKKVDVVRFDCPTKLDMCTFAIALEVNISVIITNPKEMSKTSAPSSNIIT
jgi:hypothetical protein